MIGFAPAKINLGLFVTGKRSDGYHDLESAFWPVGWNDAIEVHRKDEPGLELTVSGLAIDGDPSNNLVSRAYNLIQTRYGVGGVKAHLLKAVPMGAGLGGGSSDGTCMLKLLNQLFDLQLSDAEGESIAAELGSDCPFFWKAQPAFVNGRGEHVKPWEFRFPHGTWIAVVHPGVHVSTRDAFASIAPRPSGLDLAQLAVLPLSDWHTLLRNDFQAGIERLHPTVAAARELLARAGAAYSQMTGTGSASFGLFTSEEAALQACATAREAGWAAHAAPANG
jgi:4-diphosphocytidyl-2-C-methyl-D-erythritol kinase